MNSGVSQFAESLALRKCQEILQVWCNPFEVRSFDLSNNEQEFQSKNMNALSFYVIWRRHKFWNQLCKVIRKEKLTQVGRLICPLITQTLFLTKEESQ